MYQVFKTIFAAFFAAMDEATAERNRRNVLTDDVGKTGRGTTSIGYESDGSEANGTHKRTRAKV